MGEVFMASKIKAAEKGSDQGRTSFEKTVPVFSAWVKDEIVSLKITPVRGADRYVAVKAKTPKGKFEPAASGTVPYLTFMDPEKGSWYYMVRAEVGSGEDIHTTAWSSPVFADVVQSAVDSRKNMESFLGTLSTVADTVSFEDLDIAIESLRLRKLDLSEIRRRCQLEKEAEEQKRKLAEEEKRRKAAAERAQARREKKRLQHIEEVTSMDLPLDFENSFEGDSRADLHCDSCGDALMMSLDMLGMVDIEFIASVTGADMKNVISSLRGSIYQNPLYWNEVFYKGWETADEYLSGNLLHKYQVAKEANEQYNGYFQNNLTALEGVMNPEIDIDDIYVTLGSPWIPTDIIDNFIEYLAFGGDLGSAEGKEYFEVCTGEDYAVRHDEYTGEWEVPKKNRFGKGKFHGRFEEVNCRIFGTNRMNMLTILENTLNMKTLTVTDVKDELTKTRVLNQEETVKVLEKQEQMVRTFRIWVWEDDSRKARLRSAYQRKYGCTRRRAFDGSFLELPGLAEGVKLYDYQKDAVARIIFSPNTLLAHDVGSGKTYTMIAAGMELRRLGKSKKNLYVVPNGILGQWEQTFRMMYPEAKLLIVSHKNFDPKHRNETLNQMMNEDQDAILMSYSCFDMLSLSDSYYIELNKERKKLLEKAAKTFSTGGRLAKKREVIDKALEKLQKTYKKAEKTVSFDDLGINTLFLDEAHNYKNIDIGSRIARVRGIGGGKSDKCDGMLDKVHCVQRMNNGGRVVFATATPITNSLSDIFVMQKYLQSGELEFLGLNTFDAWAGMYAVKTTGFEIDVDTQSYHLVTRFSKFCNIPELTAALSSITDFHKVDKESGIPELSGYDISLREGSAEFKEYLSEISQRADDIRKKRVTSRKDNMLKVTSDGRKAALDMRLIDTVFGLDPDSKVMRCAENVAEIYGNTRDRKGTQIVFCDISTPKAGFNLYSELKGLLTAMGIPAEEIAFIHDAVTDAQRKELFRKMQEGEIAVLIGSTEKAGHGVNVQQRLCAAHHLDVPWRPSDMVQREGRILRQGNTNKSVRIFRYITKASFDAYSWQLLETKQRFISQIMSGTATQREGSDIDDTVLSYAEVKALAVGNPKIKRRVEVCNELEKLRVLQKSEIGERIRKKRMIEETLPEKIRSQKERIENCRRDILEYEKVKGGYEEMNYLEQKAVREKIYNAVNFNQNNPVETEVMTFLGFKVVVPAYMIPRMPIRKKETEEAGDEVTADQRKPIPYIHLVKNGSYYIEIESETGITARLNHCLEGLPEKKKKYEDVLLTYETELRTAEKELKKAAVGYEEEIRTLETELSELNAELGVA